ncbi:Arylsulfatase B [Araneus ventricosus]|uniref:Arylsulfatase B n=1 Tax=Araneus ventricosus TaxID=182803 RepID=A0A4Y2CW24_ARAVE|nr:Arylsulfatase B [Araneus ventricosus]
MVSALDHSVGEIFEALEKAKMLDNTIFVFTTDNGGAVEGTDGSLGSNYPLRGSKYNLWEGGVRATGFLWSPFLRHRSRIFNELMHISDWLPTLMSAAGKDTSLKRRPVKLRFRVRSRSSTVWIANFLSPRGRRFGDMETSVLGAQ